MVNKAIQLVKSSTFARNSIILFTGTMLASFLGYLFHLVIGRLVSVEVYGEIESITSLINIISVPAMTLVMIGARYSACCKADSDKEGTYRILKYLNKKVIVYGLPIFILAILITPIVSNFLNIESNIPFFIVWVFMFLSFFYSVNQGVLQGWQKFKAVSWIGVWGGIIKLIAGIAFVWMGFGLSGAIGGFALGAVASYIASGITLKFIIRERDKSHADCANSVDFKSIKSYVFPVFIGNLAINILGNADMVLAKHNLDSISAGQYGALTIVSKIIFFATGVIATVLFAMAAEDSHKKNNPMIILRKAMYLMAFVSFSAVIIYFAFPNLVFGMLFGGKYSAVEHYLGWFAVMVTVFSFSNLIFQYLISIRRTKVVYSLLIISAISVIVMLFFGKTISAILVIVTVSHVFAVLVGLIYTFFKGTKKIENTI